VEKGRAETECSEPDLARGWVLVGHPVQNAEGAGLRKRVGPEPRPRASWWPEATLLKWKAWGRTGPCQWETKRPRPTRVDASDEDGCGEDRRGDEIQRRRAWWARIR
jgi:hypothetical protein